MADNEHEETGAAPPPAVRPSTEITPEQIQQFQEFQQFQALMRQQAEQGPPSATPPPQPGQLQPWWPQPPKPKRRWLRVLGGKLASFVIMALLLLAGGYLAIDYFFGPDDEPAGPPSERGVIGTKDNLRLPTDPYEAVRMIYHQIANGKSGVPEQVCPRFEDDGEQFAEDMGFPDCAQAVRGLAAQVTDSNAYAESMPSYTNTPVSGDVVQISSCADNIRGGIQGGPALGAFTVKEIPGSEKGQWIIAEHRNEPPCTNSSTPPTS